MAADPFELMNRALNRGYGNSTKQGSMGRARGRGSHQLDPGNPKDLERLRSKHPDFDELLGNADIDYRTMCNTDAKFPEKFRLPPLVEPLRSFCQHDDSVDAVCWLPRSSTFMSASHDKTIKVWDAAAGTCLQTLEGHVAGVFHCSVSPTRKHFVSCGSGTVKNILLWKWPQAEVVHGLTGHKRSVLHATFAPDGMCVASTSQEGLVVVHDANRAAPLSSRQLHLGPCHCSSFCWQDSNLLVSIGRDSHIQMTDLRTSHTNAVWNLPSMVANGIFRTSLSISEAHDSYPIYAVEFVDSTTVFTCGADHKLKRWDLRMVPWGSQSTEYLGHSAPLRSMTVSPDRRFVVTGCEDGSCRVWRRDKLEAVPVVEQSSAHGSALRCLRGHVSMVSGCAWQEENGRASILSCSWDQSIKLFQLSLKDLA